MSAPTIVRSDEGLIRRLAYSVLVLAVRGRRGRGGPWGEAVLGEFPMTHGRWEAVRWSAGGLRTVWQERRARVRQRPRSYRIARRIVVTALLGPVAAVAVNQFLLTARYVPSASMEPTLQINDRYLVDKARFRLTGIQHGDIVTYAVDSPERLDDVEFVKRVIGLPGDTVECRDGRVFRNGTALGEPYLPTDPAPPRTDDCPPVTVPDDHLYVLGDHREMSVDSRHNGPVPQDAVNGRMLVRVWPVTR